jgi:hypothetical protein
VGDHPAVDANERPARRRGIDHPRRDIGAERA